MKYRARKRHRCASTFALRTGSTGECYASCITTKHRKQPRSYPKGFKVLDVQIQLKGDQPGEGTIRILRGSRWHDVDTAY